MRWLRNALLCAAIFSPALAHAAPDISVNFSRQTGVAPFDGNNAPGNDRNSTNNIIRTNDIISYKFEVVVLNEDATNIVLRLSVGPGLELDLPAFCRETGVSPQSTVSGTPTTGYSIVCNVGDISQGSQVLYALPATVVPEQPNNSTVALLTASVESDQTAQESFPGGIDTVSAAPKIDLVKDDHSRLIGRRSGPNGEDGVLYLFSIELLTQNNGRGNELVTGNVSFTDDLSNVSPNALLYEGWTGALSEACAPNYATTTQRLSRNPHGSVRAADGGPNGPGAGPAEESVWDSGTIDCSAAAAGGTTTVTISGADLTGRHFPSEDAGGRSLPANVRYLVSGVMAVWIPITDIQAAGGQLQVDNVFSPLNALSISGQSNTEPDLANNRRDFIARDGGSGRYFYNHTDHDDYAVLPSQTSRRSGDGYVLPDQIFATRHYQNNGAWLTKQTLDNFSFCTSFDNSTQRITEITPGQGAKMTYDGTSDGAQPPFTIEYGTGAFGGSVTCENGDSPTGWYSDINSVPGGAAAVTKVRSNGAYIAAPGGNSTNYRANLIVRYTALDNPAGTIVSEYGTFRNDQQNNGNWILSTYDENTALGNYGDRLFLTKVAVRVNKDSEPSGEDQVLAGDPLSFKIQPSATTPGDPPQLTTDVTVTDTLPEWYQYVLGSASPPPSDFTNNPDGTTSLVWEFPETVINSPMAPITYDVNVTPTTPDQTSSVNTVVISSENDGSPENQRTDTHIVLVLNPAGFSVSKSAVPVLVAPDKTFAYRLTYANTGTSDFASVQFIDILPNRQVALSPPTAFDGGAAFVSASGTAGETFEYSRSDPTMIEEDPTAASNQPGGSTVWCSAFSGGTCPASAADVTAVRGTSPAFMQGQPPRDVTITMQGNANDAFNAYSNRFVAKAEGLAFSVTSPVATVYVRTADVSLTKTVDGPDSTNPNLVTFVLTASNAGPHTAEGVEITDALPSGFVYFDHTGSGDYDWSSGIWTPENISVGGSRSLTLRAEVVPGGDYTNLAEVTAQLYADPDSKPGNRATEPNEDDVASASVTRLSGKIFLDNGIGGGVAHDGIPNGGELGGAYGTISLSDAATGTVQVIANVSTDGSWSAVLASGLPDDFDVVFTPDPNYLLMSEGGAGLPGLLNADPRDGIFRFTPGEGAEYTGLDFGLVAEPVLTQDQVAAIGPGAVVDLAHRYEATSAGSVVFALANQIANPANGFSSTVFSDADCDGSPEAPILMAISVVAGQSVCIVVRSQAGNGVGDGASYSYAISATTTFSGVPVTHSVANNDRLTVGNSSDQLVLRKLVRNITANSPETTVNTGNLGDILAYRLVLTNPGTGPATNVTVNDTVPAWTTLFTPVTPSATIAPGVTCTLSEPAGASNAFGYAGPLRWLCSGAFPPGAEGSLTFQVQITP